MSMDIITAASLSSSALGIAILLFSIQLVRKFRNFRRSIIYPLRFQDNYLTSGYFCNV